VQIAAGALLAWPTLGLHVALDPELFLFLFLPPLLFSDGWRMPKREFWRLRGPILTLAVGLVLFTVVGAGYFIHWLLPTIPLPVAFALAAVLSPTDAVAVTTCPAVPSVMPRSRAIGVNSPAGRNSADTSAKLVAAIERTANHVAAVHAGCSSMSRDIVVPSNSDVVSVMVSLLELGEF